MFNQFSTEPGAYFNEEIGSIHDGNADCDGGVGMHCTKGRAFTWKEFESLCRTASAEEVESVLKQEEISANAVSEGAIVC